MCNNEGYFVKEIIMNKRFSILALVLAFFVLCSAFVACSTDQNDTPDKPKSVPIYQGMTVSAVDNSSRVASASFSFAQNRLSSPVRGNPTDRDPGWWDGDKYGRGDDFDPDKPFGDGATTIEDAASGTLEVVGGGETYYNIYSATNATEPAKLLVANENVYSITINKIEGKYLYYTANSINYKLDLDATTTQTTGEVIGNNLSTTATGWSVPDSLTFTSGENTYTYVFTLASGSVSVVKFDATTKKNSSSATITLTVAVR